MPDTAARVSPPGYTIGATLRHWARTRPSEDAIVAELGMVTWSGLLSLVEGRRRLLAEQGVRPGHTVAVMGRNSLDWCVGALAVTCLGGTILPVGHRTVAPELTHLVEHSGAAAILADAGSRAVADEAAASADQGVAVLPVELDHAPPRTAVRPDAPIDGDPAAVVAYTSGTTGAPKGVELTHANLLIGSWFLRSVDLSPRVRILLVQPISYTSGLISTFLASICNGWTVVLEPAFDPDRALARLEEQRITTFRSVPLIWDEIAAAAGFEDADLSALATAHVGGAPVGVDVMAVWQDRGVALCQGYGMTETSGAVTFATPSQASNDRRTVGSGGPHCDIVVRADDGEPAPSGSVGEIFVRGPAVTRGYRRDPDATAVALADGWLRTGDLGVRGESGQLEIVGRARDLIISGGINVHPAEVEALIASVPGVLEVAVVGIDHPRFAEVPAAVVRVEGGLTPDEIVAHCRRGLAGHKVPHLVVLADEPLPRTTSGKLRKDQVRARWLPSQAPRG